MNEKFVHKFNSLVSLFLEDLVNCLPDNDNVNQVSAFFNSVVAVDPGNTELLTKFMTILQGCSDFLVTHNTDLFSHAKDLASSIDKNDIIDIYKNLKDTDREIFWKYLNKMYNIGKKALPEMVKNIEFDYNSLTPQSPIFGLIDRKQPVTQIVTKSSKKTPKSKRKPDGTMISNAFMDTAVTFVKSVQIQAHDNDLTAISESCQQSIDGISASNTEELLEIFRNTYASDDTSMLVTDTETALMEHGFPFLGNIELPVNDSITQAALKLGTLYITLTQMSSEIISDMESIATKFTDQIASGAIDIDLNNLDPMSIIAQLSNTDIGADLMKIINKI
jgi:hypothetical protein